MISQDVTSQPLNTSNVEGTPSVPAAVPAPSRSQRKPYRRKANWKKEASLLLLNLVVKHWRVIGGKGMDECATARQKTEVWRTITQEINAAFPDVVRDVVEVEKKWWGLKGQGKEELKQYRKAMHRADGNPPPKEQLSEVALAVKAFLGQSTESILGLPLHLDAIRLQVHELPEKVDSTSTCAVYDPLPLQFCVESPQEASIPSEAALHAEDDSSSSSNLPAALPPPPPPPTDPDPTFEAEKRKLELAILRAKVECVRAQKRVHEADVERLLAQKRAYEADVEYKALLSKKLNCNKYTE